MVHLRIDDEWSEVRKVLRASLRTRAESPATGEPIATASARINIRHRVASPQVDRLCLISENGVLVAIGMITQERRSGDLDVLVHLKSVHILDDPLNLDRALDFLSARVRIHADQALKSSATLTPAAGVELLQALAEMSSEAARVLDLVQGLLRDAESVDVSQAALELHDAVSLGLRLAGFEAGTLAGRRPGDATTPGNYFSRMLTMTGRPSSEAGMIRHDSSHFGEWFGQEAAILDVVEFTDPRNASRRVTVMYADKEAEERVTGADLIYYREHFPGFVLVQYKRMRREGSGAEGRYGYRPDEQLREELGRMRKALAAIPVTLNSDVPLSWWRLHDQPFYIKLVEEGRLRPERGDLITGMYFPVDLFEFLLEDPEVRGPKLTRSIGWHNAGRWLTNTHFLTLMQDGWIGSAGLATEYLQALVSEVWATGRGALVVEDHTPIDAA